MQKNQDRFSARDKRIDDVISLKTPDRVPFCPQTNLLPLKYGDITGQDAFYDYGKWFQANKKMIIELQPDLYWPTAAALPGRCFDILQCKQIKWPGHGAPVNSTIQYVDQEYMKADELSSFIDDPTDYLIGTYLPRIFDSLTPLATLPQLKTLFYQGYKSAYASSVFTSPEVVEAFLSLYKSGMEARKYFTAEEAFAKEMQELGFVQAFSGTTVWCPYDVIGDNHRGIRGVMMDMLRQPDTLLAAMEKIEPFLIEAAANIATKSGNKRIFMPLHLGADGFMSPQQFETFYWPGLKRTILALIELGQTPCPFFEGDYTSRLEYLTELPKGKVLGIFDKTDIVKAKKILGNTMCIAGNMPSSLLQMGTLQEVEKYTKTLIDNVGQDGGFIMSSRSVLDEANPRLVKVWEQVTKEYGRY